MIDWISVKDDLPKSSKQVIVLLASPKVWFQEITFAEYRKEWFIQGFTYPGLVITHWAKYNAPKLGANDDKVD